MTEFPPLPAPLPRAGARWVWAGALAIALGVALAYRRALSGPFIFDDLLGIARNATLRRLWPPWLPLLPPAGSSLSGRPLVNLSFALNYAWSGLDVRGYHAANIAIHLAAALTLFGILRRTLSGRLALAGGGLLALAAALLWAVHPVQTEAVTYLIQRLESLMGLFYLLTLYCLIRAAEWGPCSRGWEALCVFCCLLGMASKEVMATAPAVALCYDRTFLSGSFLGAWRRRRGLYIALASTWVLVGWLALGTHDRGGTAGFGIGVGWGSYLLTQFPALLGYLRLAVFPAGQDFDYGARWVAGFSAVLPEAVAVAALLGLSLALFLRRGLRSRSVGWAGLCFFAILAPTSLVPGIRQTMAEHRLYLALAPLLALGVCGVCRLLLLSLGRSAPAVTLAAAGAAAIVLIGLTLRRNGLYASPLLLWRDTVSKSPLNPYAHNNLGNFELMAGRPDEAVRQYEDALRLKPDYAEAHNNLGTAYARQRRLDLAIAQYREAIRLDPRFYAEAHDNLGVALAQSGDLAGATAEFRRVVQASPASAEAHFNLGNALADAGRLAEAVAQYREAAALGLRAAALSDNLGEALAREGRLPQAEAEYREALRLDPASYRARNDLGAALAALGRTDEARAQFEEALRLRPDYLPARRNLARLGPAP